MTIRSDDTAHCSGVDTELFFPHDDSSARIDQAKAVCKGCPFIDPCLDYGLRHMVDGIWGGKTPRERRTMRAKLRIVAEPLSFGSGPTNSSTAKRMAKRGTPVATIAAHLSLTTEAVYRILRDAKVDIPEARSKRGIAERSTCAGCGTTMLRSSLGRHQREVCSGRGQVAS